MIPSLILTLRYREPLLLTGNVFALIFFASLGDQGQLPGARGRGDARGAIVLATAVLGLTGRIASLIPVPIVNGVIAGAVLPFVVGVFSFISTADGHVGIEVPSWSGPPWSRTWSANDSLARGYRRSCPPSSQVSW